MGKTLTYDEFIQKYVISVGGDDLKGAMNDVGAVEMKIIDDIFEGVCKDLYEEYLSGSLNFIDKDDIPEK